MKSVLAILLLLLTAFGGVNRIANINKHTDIGQQAMATGKYKLAVKSYELLLDSLKVDDDRARLNLAHAYFKTGQKDKAYKVYSALLKKENKYLQSVSALQLGILSAGFKDYPEALRFYKQALIIEPENEQARYNYELLKKYLRENPEAEDQPDQIPPPQPEQQQKDKEQDKNKASQKSDEQGSEQQEIDTNEPNPDQKQNQQQKPDQKGNLPKSPSAKPGDKEKGGSRETPEGNREEEQLQGEEPGDEKGMGQGDEPENKTGGKGGRSISDKNENAQTRYQRLKQMNISPEKANMILDAMKESEQQYIQQIPRKGKAKKDRSRPDW